MKKVIALLLAVVLCFSLCACGSQSEPELTKEELISTDLKTDIMTLQGEVYSNRVKAMQDYGNKPIIVTVEPITAGGITLFIHFTPASLTIAAITT